jgi:heme exporter protein CcmD
MGGYAAYVWSAFGLTVTVLVFNVVTARRRLRAALQEAALKQAREAHRRNRS